ncbi:unnamed protein product [Durusdinium trenchii]|uniref:Uncharacterized protein n=1 Tax=Durusdinium trenchii TaxID=1381693 RepID=A0ABP0JZZ4_9DINO
MVDACEDEQTALLKKLLESDGVAPPDYLFGLNKLLTALEGINGQSLLDKRGELRNMFYLELKRAPNERVAEFCTRFRSLVADLAAEGVTIQPSEQGWFLRQKLGLDSLRQQLLETALAGREEYSVVEAECLRLFKDLHQNDPLRRFDRGDRPKLTIRRLFQSQGSRGPSSSASTISRSPSMFSAATSARSSNSTSTRRAYVTEADDPPDQQPEEVLETTAYEGNLEEVIQSEAEVLATELQEAEEQGVDPALLEDMESSFEQAAEALVTMKEAKSRLQEVRKDRGFGKAGALGGGRQNAGVPAARKASGKHPCFDCNQHGHWAGDKECPKPGAGLGRKGPAPAAKAKAKVRQVRVTEAFQAEHVEPLAPSPSSTSSPPENPGSPHEVNMVLRGSSSMSLEQAFEQSLANAFNSTLMSSTAQDLATEKHLVGALDSACNRSCAGPTWLSSYVEQLEFAPPFIRDLLQSIEETERFKFGNGGLAISSKRWRLPACVGGRVFLVWINEVPIPSLGCLLGCDVLDALGAVLDFGQRTLHCTSLFDDPQHRLELKQMAAGHFMLEMIPTTWPRLGPGKWRRCGLDGVVELQLTPRSWLERRVAEGCFGANDYLRDDLKYLIMETSPPTSTQPLKMSKSGPLEPLTPSLVKAFKQEHPRGFVPYRWNRFALRLMSRNVWHAQSILIQFASRSHLRFLPFPYPSIGSVEQWLLQAQSMVNMNTLSRRHHHLALEAGSFTAENLIELGRLRDRCGWKTAFLEDGLLAGFIAARAQKGQREKLRAAALEETKARVAQESAEMDREIMARIRPLVELLKNKAPPSTSEQLRVERLDPLASKTPTSSTWSAVEAGPTIGGDHRSLPTAFGDGTGRSRRDGCGPHQGLNLVQEDFKLHGKLKKGISQMISQAWHRHRRDQLALSVGSKEIQEVFMATWDMEMREALNETFAMELRLPSTFITEVYTDTEPVAHAARRRGLNPGDSLTLGTGWDFRLAEHRKAALALIKKTKPYVVVLAFPCSAWSQLLALNAAVNLEKLRAEAHELVAFAIEVAQLQLKSGRHYLMENPRSSMAWKLEVMEDFVTSTGALEVVVDMCRFNLRAPGGELHKKATKLVTSMQALISIFLNKRCLGDHPHTPVIGGKQISAAAGHYTKEFSDAVIDGCMQQYDFERSLAFKHSETEFEVMSVEHEVMVVGDEEDLDSEASFEPSKDDEEKPIPAAIKNAVYRLHVNTSHRSNQRLARALLICGAPKEAVLAAKRLKCPVCAERRNPKPRPAKPTLSKLLAIRETSRLSMIRLHYSRGLRQAELARSRSSTVEDQPQPGDLVFFWRAQKYQSRKDVGAGTRRRLLLRRWHGPGLLVATEGRHGTELAANCFISFRGQLTKCPFEHVRKASSLESIAAGSWEAAIDEVISAAKDELRREEDANEYTPSDGPIEEAITSPRGNEPLAGGLQPYEIVAALQPPASVVPSMVGRSVPASLHDAGTEPTEAPGTAAPGTPVPSLILQASQAPSRLTSPMAGSPMSRTLERARAFDEQAAGQTADRGTKRPAEDPLPSADTVFSDVARPAFEALELTHAELENLAENKDIHPLLRLQAMVDADRRVGDLFAEPDHSSWDGKWGMLCERDWQLLHRLGAQLPSGAPPEHDVLALQTARKEYQWSKMSGHQKKLWGEAAVTGWKAYIDNSAVEVLSLHESSRIRKELSRRGELDRILDGQSFWHRLEAGVTIAELSNQHALISELPAATVALAFLTAHGLVRLARWLHQALFASTNELCWPVCRDLERGFGRDRDVSSWSAAAWPLRMTRAEVEATQAAVLSFVLNEAEVECLEKIGATLLKNDEQDDEGVDLFSTSEAGFHKAAEAALHRLGQHRVLYLHSTEVRNRLGQKDRCFLEELEAKVLALMRHCVGDSSQAVLFN